MSQLILASQSPRRQELLQQLGFGFSVQPANIDESVLSGEPAASYVERLARQKAGAIFSRMEEPCIVLGADTIVMLDGEIFGKPVNKGDAMRMLSMLSGKTHQVLTGVGLIWEHGVETIVTRSDVRFSAIPEHDASHYWDTGEPQDKAGSYAIQGLGAVFVEHLDGSYSNVMGLPLFETAELLKLAGLSVFDR